MRLSLFAFLAINRLLLAAFADASSVRGGAPADLTQYDHDNEAPTAAGKEEDHFDLTPLQRRLLDGELLDEELFKRALIEQSRHRALQSPDNDIFQLPSDEFLNETALPNDTLNEDDCVENHNVDYFDIDVSIQPTYTLPRIANQQIWVCLDMTSTQFFGSMESPTLLQQRRQLSLQRRRVGFIYTGIGGCNNFCGADDSDHRLLLENKDMLELFQNKDSRKQRNLASDWFENTFKPQLEITLENAFMNEVAPLHRKCVGWIPTVEVNVKGVDRFQDLESPCADADPNTIGLLKSFNLDAILLSPKQCETCVKIDFSTLKRGDWVRHQYWEEHGVNITAWSSKNICRTPNSAGRIFDTAISDLDPDLGSPNESCGGSGVGDGGRTGSGGENCQTVGNALIIQQGQGDPNDCVGGGKITFSFKEPVLFSDFGVMDIEQAEQAVIFEYSDGSRKNFIYKGFGDNGVQRVVANQYDVVRAIVVFDRAAAITEFNFCPECN